MLGARCDAETQRRIADGAEWNFLFLTLLCEAITQDDYAPEEIDQFLTGGDFSWGRAGIAASIRYTCGIPCQGCHRRPMPNAMPARQHTRR